MSRKDTIGFILEKEFAPSRLVIYDESAQHAGHSGAKPEGETHFRIEISSQKFSGLSRVACHRMVNDALRDLFKEGLHALSIQARDH